MRPQSPVSEVVFQQTVTVIPPEALHTISSAPLSAQLEAKVSLFYIMQMFLSVTDVIFNTLFAFLAKDGGKKKGRHHNPYRPCPYHQ